MVTALLFMTGFLSVTAFDNCHPSSTASKFMACSSLHGFIHSDGAGVDDHFCDTNGFYKR
jgi:hypothetical protein